MSEVTILNQTTNQIQGDYNYEQTFIFDNKYITGNFLNNTGAKAEFAEGLVVGRIADGGANNGKIVPLDPAAVDGSQFPLGILKRGTISLADAAEAAVTVGVAGDVNENKVSFEGATTLDTIVSLRTLRDRIASDTLGIQLVESTELSDYDNQ